MSVNQLKAGVILNYVVIGLNVLVGLLYTPYMLRMMGQNEYGLYSLVASVIGYLTIMDFGLGNAIVRYTAKYRAEGKTEEQYSMFGMFLTIYSIIGIVAFMVGLAVCFNTNTLFGDTMSVAELHKARILMLIMTFNIAITFPFSIFGAIITAYEDFIFQRAVNIVRILLNTGVMVALLYMGHKAIAMVIVQTIFNFLTLAANTIYAKQKIGVKIKLGKFQWNFLSEVLFYSFWIFLNAIMDKIYWSTGQFVLGAVSGTIAVAIFAVAIQLQTMYMSFSTSISGVFLPRVTSMVAKNNSDKEISDLFIKTGRIQYIVMGFILVGFILFGKQFILLWAGEGYENAYTIALLFFIPLTIPLIQNMGMVILQARNQLKFRSLLYVSIAILSLIFQIPLGKKYGGIGCAIAIAGALVIGQIIIMNVYYYKVQHINIFQFWKEIIKMSIVPIIVGIIFFYILKNVQIVSIFSFIMWVSLFSSIYIPLFLIFSMNKYERELAAKPIRKIFKKISNRKCFQ